MASWSSMARLKAGASTRRETWLIEGPQTPGSSSSMGPTSAAILSWIRLDSL